MIATDDQPIPALSPQGPGHQFLFFGDSCSGVPGAPHEASFAATNAVVRRLDPQPEFVVFPGDEVIGLTADAEALRAQWRHWLEVEMAWLDRQATPLFHSTSNHTTYDAMSEGVFTEMLPDLPRNGPDGQEGLSYFVRRGDLLLVFVHTLPTGLGGEGHVETAWLRATLQAHADARHKLVVGHHPVFPVNGFSGPYQRELGQADGAAFWSVLIEQGVLAYLCSHILAFDVQVHQGVLQITSAGAGTLHRMPEGAEYLHCVQAALDAEGLRYQVLDQAGQVRERLQWPLRLPPSSTWLALDPGEQATPIRGGASPDLAPLVGWHFTGCAAPEGTSAPQTLLAAWAPGSALAPLWIGLRGGDQRLTVTLAPQAGRSPHYWFGPALIPGEPFELQLLCHAGMGPGGLLWRLSDGTPWTSLESAGPWGAERLDWPERWSLGQGKAGPEDQAFLGRDLTARVFVGAA